MNETLRFLSISSRVIYRKHRCNLTYNHPLLSLRSELKRLSCQGSSSYSQHFSSTKQNRTTTKRSISLLESIATSSTSWLKSWFDKPMVADPDYSSYNDVLQQTNYLIQVAQGQVIGSASDRRNCQLTFQAWKRFADPSSGRTTEECIDSARKADELLMALEQQFTLNRIDTSTSTSSFLVPVTLYYSCVINAYVYASECRKVAESAHNVLCRMIKLSSDERCTSVKLDISEFNLVIYSFNRSTRRKNFQTSKQSRETAIKAEQILDNAIDCHAKGLLDTFPTNVMFDLVLQTWATSPKYIIEEERGKRCHNLLLRMIRLYRKGILTDLSRDEFFSCLKCWSEAYSSEFAGVVIIAPDRAEDVMEWLISIYKETGKSELKPDLQCWNQLLLTWVRSSRRPNAMDKCFAIKHRMTEYCDPNSNTYSYLIRAAAYGGMGGTAVALFEQMRSNPKLIPGRHILGDIASDVLIALAKEKRSDSFDRVQAFFDSCVKSNDVQVGIKFYYKMIYFMSQSTVENKAERAHTLLIDAQQRYQEGNKRLKLNKYVLLNAIQACRETTGSVEKKEEALRIALEMFHTSESRFGMKVITEKIITREVQAAIDDLAPKDKRLETALLTWNEAK